MLMLLSVLGLVLLSLLIWFLFRRGGAGAGRIPIGLGPIRTPGVTVTGSVFSTFPRCNGTFDGSGQVVATYPAAGPGKGPPATVKASLKVVDADNVDVSINAPDTVTITGPAD